MSIYQNLYEAIKAHADLDDETIIDAGQHGADAGWSGFTYYTDSCAFYEKNEKAIWELLEEAQEMSGNENVIELIGSFGGAKLVGNLDQFKNLLAWFALEEVGRWLSDKKEAETN